MATPGSEPALPRAPQVCISCKTRKRKCDKSLPACSQCSKRNLVCEYSKQEPRHWTASTCTQPWDGVHVNGSPEGPQQVTFPTLLFLDPGMLQNGQVDLPQAAFLVPEQPLHLLGDVKEIHLTTASYFNGIHQWMPFISKKRLYDLHLRVPYESRPDIVLLLLAIKLIITMPPSGPRNARTSLYHTVKYLYMEVQESSSFSVQVLQAGILIALYELGHGIYPAAYLSIGGCARYAYAIGIKSSRELTVKHVLTRVEVEERRRVWWSIVILDRFVSVGCPGRPFATADPQSDDLLPANDAAWDEAIVNQDDYYTLSSPMTSHMSKFALLCQGARLLGQVLNIVSDGAVDDDDVWLQLDRTLQSLVNASLEASNPDYDQITFAYSALVALYAPWLYSNNRNKGNTSRCQRAKVGMQLIKEKMETNLLEKECFSGRDPETLTPWGIFFAYHICGMEIHNDGPISNSSGFLQGLKKAFAKIDTRWNVAGIYLELLEAREVMCTC